MKPFKLVAPYSPGGDQPQAIEHLVGNLKEGHPNQVLLGATGTGKTFTSLKVAEQVAGEGKRVLFLVPSLALLSQTLTEWTQESDLSLHSFAVCSDADIGKRRTKNSEAVETLVHELQYPATTDAERLAHV